MKWFRQSGRVKARSPRSERLFGPTLEILEDRVQPSAAPSLGAAAGFGVLGLANTQINNSNVTISGNEGVSQGGKLTNMAPSTIEGDADEYAAGQYSGPGHLGGSVVIDPNLMSQADSDALSASAQAAALTPTVTLGNINSPTTVTGNGGLNVIAVNGNITSSLTLTGTSSDVFVVNVTGTVTLNGNTVLGVGGGVTPAQVLYNFTGESGTITSKVGNVFYGTLLAPTYSFNLDGTFDGEIIGGGKSIVLLSGAKVNPIPFAPPIIANQGTASLSGFVDFDNNFGVFLHPVQDAVLTLTNAQGQVVATTTTAADGSYSFGNLVADTYTITLSVPNGDAVSNSPGTVNGVTDGSDGNNAFGTAGVINQITLAAGNNGINYNFNLLLGG